MPEGLKKLNGDTDWTKFFMAMAAGAIVVMQSYSQMQHSQTREDIRTIEQNTVPRTELLHQTVSEHSELVGRFTRSIDKLEARVSRLEVQHGKE